MLRQSRLRASRASPAQKSRDLRVIYSKNFSRTTFFVFWRTHLVDMFLSYYETNFEDKVQCDSVNDSCNGGHETHLGFKLAVLE